MHGGSNRTRTLKFEICQRPAVHIPIFCRLATPGAFCFTTKRAKSLQRSGSAVVARTRNCRILCVPIPPMFAYYSGAFENGGQAFIQLLWRTAIKVFMVMSFVCFIWTAEFGVPELFLPNRLRAF